MWFYLLLLSFPTAFFFGSVYTESLFLLLLVLSFQHPIFSLFSGLTRINGTFTLFVHKKYFFLPIIGLLIYCFYLLTKFNDPFIFFHNVANFGVQRSSHLISLPQVYYRYLSIFFTASFNFQYCIAILEFTIFNFFLLILFLDLRKILSAKIVNDQRLSLNIFSWCNLLLPTLSGSLSSVPRYALLSVSAFFYLSEIKSKPLKTATAIGFTLLEIILTIFFIQGYFIS